MGYNKNHYLQGSGWIRGEKYQKEPAKSTQKKTIKPYTNSLHRQILIQKSPFLKYSIPILLQKRNYT